MAAKARNLSHPEAARQIAQMVAEIAKQVG
jgi:hypothetical protein